MAVHIRSLKEIANLNKDLVLGDPPLDGQRPYFRVFKFWDPSPTHLDTVIDTKSP